MAKAMNVADAIITLCNKKFKCGTKGSQYKYPISNLYLQKLMYFLNVIHMFLKHSYDKPLITDNTFEKWTYGPVIYSVYEEYKEFNGDHINKTVPHVIDIKVMPNDTIKGKTSSFTKNDLSKPYSIFTCKQLPLLLQVGPFDLVDISHNEPQWLNKSHGHTLYNNKASLDYYKSMYNLRRMINEYR